MKIVIAGDRNWSDPKPIANYLAHLIPNETDRNASTVIHGDCRGADRLGAVVARALGYKVVAFPANWNRQPDGSYDRSAGPKRNRKMLDEHPDIVVGFHDYYENSRGTRDTLTEAERRGFSTVLVSHGGIQTIRRQEPLR